LWTPDACSRYSAAKASGRVRLALLCTPHPLRSARPSGTAHPCSRFHQRNAPPGQTPSTLWPLASNNNAGGAHWTPRPLPDASRRSAVRGGGGRRGRDRLNGDPVGAEDLRLRKTATGESRLWPERPRDAGAEAGRRHGHRLGQEGDRSREAHIGYGDVSASRKRAPRRPSSPAADRVPARSRTQRCQHRRQIQLQPAEQIESFLLLHDKVRPAQALIHEGAPVGVPSAPPRPPRRRRSFTS